MNKKLQKGRVTMKKMNKLIAILLSISCLAAVSGCSGSNVETEQTSNTTTQATLNENAQQTIDEIASSGETKELENKKVTWFCHWAMNPPEGDPARTSLEIFKSKYGGEVEDIICSYDERNTKLATLIAADQSPDLISGTEYFPALIAKGMCMPVDDYVAFDNEIWSNIKALNEKYQINGKTYWPIFTTGEAGYMMVYNKKTIEENELEDPAQLYADGNWNWDAFYEMGQKFLNNGEGRYVTTGWWFEEALVTTTGTPALDFVNGKVVNNINSSALQRVEEFLYECSKQSFAVAEDAPKGVRGGTTLFYPSGAKNPEGAGAFIECARMAVVDEDALSVRKEQILNDYKWTDEMYQMMLSMQEIETANGVIDLTRRMEQDIVDTILTAETNVYRNGDSWSQLRESIYGTVDSSVETVNKSLDDMQ